MRFKRFYAFLIPVFMISLLMAPAMPVARATDPDEVVRTFAPTAYGSSCYGGGYGPLKGKMLDRDPVPLGLSIDGAFVATWGFQSTSYLNYWNPWQNRSNFPPNNASILSVSMIAIVWSQIARNFDLECRIEGPINTTSIQSPTYTTAPLGSEGVLFSYNITSLYYNWTPTLVKSTAAQGQIGSLTIILSARQPTNKVIYVDYVGLDYIWTNATTAGGGGPETEFGVMNLDVPGLMGIFGFVGMMAVPAASIWFFRHDGGGSKIYVGVMAFVAFTVCFGLFLGSINGG